MASDITNITGGDDLFNRYKMPRIVAKVEGRGNGIKTRIVNCSQVAKALHRPPSYVCKFFGCELGAQTKIEEKSDVYIVNGAHEQQVLMEVLQKFIKMFVLCANCNLPETDLQVDKKGNIKQVCAACGHSELVNMTHKLCTYIQNHPPEGKSTSKKDAKKEKKKKEDGEGGKKTSRSRKKKGEDDAHSKRSSKSNQTSSQESNEEDGGEDGIQSNTVETEVLPPGGLGNANLDELAENAAKSLVISRTESAKQSQVGGGEADENLEWCADTSKEAIKARQAEAAAAAKVLEGLTDSKKKKNVNVPVENDKEVEKDPTSLLREFGANHGIPAIAEKVLELFPSNQNSLLDQTEQVLRSLLTSEDQKGLERRVQRIAGVIRALAASVGHSQIPVDIQWKICHYMEVLCEESSKVPVAVILKVFYDEDLVEEDVILKWYYSENRGVGGKVARNNASMLVEWLENAESESDSSA
jgi:translation initiation factor 5